MVTPILSDSKSLNHGDIDTSPTTVTDFLIDLRTKLNTWLTEAKDTISLAGPICNSSNSLLSDARLRLERASVLWAQTQYLDSAINGQLDTLKKIYEVSRKQVRQNRGAFEKSLKKLDKQDIKLQRALKVLEECKLDRAIEVDNEFVKRKLEILEHQKEREEQQQMNQNEGIGASSNVYSMDEVDDKQILKEIEESDIQPRNLRGFVDEDAIAQLRASTTESIDFIQQTLVESEEMLNHLGDAITNFSNQEEMMEDLQVTLGHSDFSQDSTNNNSSNTTKKMSLDRKSGKNKANAGNTWKYMIEQGLESAHDQTTQIAAHAHAMAMLLESLARHYDQCCQAIELIDSVEGINTSSDNKSGNGNGVDSGVGNNAASPTIDYAQIQSRITQGQYDKEQLEDLEDLAVVLSTDSTELAPVLTELEERHTEISELSNEVRNFQANLCERAYRHAKKRFDDLELFGNDMQALVQELEHCKERSQSGYIKTPSNSGTSVKSSKSLESLGSLRSPTTQTGTDTNNNEESTNQRTEFGHNIGINTCIQEMESLVEYYTLFHLSYQKLILEIRRRLRFRSQMQSVFDDMAVRVGKMITDELQERKQLFEAVADYLPGDLWPRLVDGPPFIEMTKAGTWNLPEIGVDSVEIAKKVSASIEYRGGT